MKTDIEHLVDLLSRQQDTPTVRWFGRERGGHCEDWKFDLQDEESLAQIIEKNFGRVGYLLVE